MSQHTDGAALAARLRRLPGAVRGGSPADPRRLAEQVLARCAAELGLPRGMGIWWDELPNEWGVVDPAHPTVLRLNKRLFRNQRQLVETTAHECMHAHRILAGNAHFDDVAERAATDYGRGMARRWRFV